MKTISSRKKSVSRRLPSAQDEAKKELKIKMLIGALSAQGLSIRREKLKQGHGWKTVSGACRLSSNRMVFVDRKMPLDEQILFLSSVAQQAGLDLDQVFAGQVPASSSAGATKEAPGGDASHSQAA